MPPVVSPVKQKKFVKLRQEGWARTAAAKQAGVSARWAFNFEHGHENNGNGYKQAKAQGSLPLPLSMDQLCAEALRGLEDFEFFRWYYLGHVSTPWQIETSDNLVTLAETPQKEYVVENCAPGTGKTTLIHDLACWFTVRDRRLRGLIGSRVEQNARRMLSRIKRSLERPLPAKAPTELIEKGLAVDAQASLAQHYGIFKPSTHGDVWRADEFVVAQLDDIPIEEKEPTWSSYGLDSGVLSNRFNLIFWDDLIDRRTNRTAEARADLVAKWDEELENRLEPGGLLAVIGQRLHPEDLYSTLRDRELVDDEGEPAGKMYHHIVYPAHDEEKCEGVHHPSEAEPWPNGCLLDPYRLPWAECRKLQTKRNIWPVVYQQTDGDPTMAFVHPLWITGGTGKDGVQHPGCWDKDRGLAELPKLEGRTISVAMVDPSPTKYWAVEWVVYHPDSEYRFIMDIEKRAMEAPEFFDFNPVTRAYTGLMVDWQERSVALGHPITHWIIERNAAQRFMLQQTSLKQYLSKAKVNLIPHETTMNKSDSNFGVQSIAPHFEHGRVRLPGKPQNPGRLAAMKLVDEVLRWPDGSTDDCVMAYWFFEWNLPKITSPDRSKMPTLTRPSWFKREKVPA